MSDDNTKIIPQEYEQISIDFREKWEEYKGVEEEAKSLIVRMVEVLEKSGYERTEAIEKIHEDHRDLKGFSRQTVYRELPDKMKREYSSRDIRKGLDDTNKLLHVSNGTYEGINTSDQDDSVKLTTEHPVITEEEANKILDDQSLDVVSTPEPHTTFEYHKASEEDQQIKQFKLESDVDKYRKLAFDKQQQIEELEIKLERLTNQVNTQAEAIRQQNTAPTQDTPKIFPFTLQTKTLLHECPKCHLQQDLPVTGRVYHQNSWVVYIDNIEAQKQQAQKWRNV